MPKIPLYKKHKDKMYGSTLVGARGQVVIPADARKDLGISPGDRLMVIGKGGMVISLIRADKMAGLLSEIMEDMDNAGVGEIKEMQEHAKRSLRKMLKTVKKGNGQ